MKVQEFFNMFRETSFEYIAATSSGGVKQNLHKQSIVSLGPATNYGSKDTYFFVESGTNQKNVTVFKNFHDIPKSILEKEVVKVNKLFLQGNTNQFGKFIHFNDFSELTITIE